MMARKVMAAFVVGAIGIGPALAQEYDTQIVQALQEQGYRDISTERTWLGRVRIVAETSDGRREIVLNPNNGEILRDSWLERRGDAGGTSLAQTGGSSGGGGSSSASVSVASTTGAPSTGGGSSGGASGSTGGSSGGSSTSSSSGSGTGSGSGSSGGTSSSSTGGSSGGSPSDDDGFSSGFSF